MERIWFKDLTHLYQNYDKFFPSKDMSFAEQLNTMMRISIYFAIVIYVLKTDVRIFMIPLFVGLFTFIIYTIDTKNKINERLFLEDHSIKKDRRTKELCQKPLPQNPFMNVLVSDYVTNPTRKKACDIRKSNISKQVNNYFDKNLYRSVSDIFNKEASDRQWVTNPVTTIPNDQNEFARWCYQSKPTCKEGNGNRCHSNTYRTLN